MLQHIFICRSAALKNEMCIRDSPNTTHPVIALMPDQNGVEDIGGTLRLGSYPCVLDKDSLAYNLYGEEMIHERHRHRYEVNNDFRAALTEHGMKLSGISPDGRIIEMCELSDHPFFIATQAVSYTHLFSHLMISAINADVAFLVIRSGTLCASAISVNSSSGFSSLQNTIAGISQERSLS